MGGVPDVINGVQTAAFYRETAWHSLGTVFQDEVTTVEEMAQRAHIDNLEIRKEPIDRIGDVTLFSSPLVAITARIPGSDDRRVLSVASPAYEVRQVEEIMSWTNVAGTDGARWETAFLMNEGRQVAASIAFDVDIVIDPNGVGDVVKNYLMVAGSFDGTLANVCRLTPVRVVCENTLNAALGNYKTGFSFKSTKNVRERVAEWHKAQALVANGSEAFQKEAQRLFEKPLTKDTFFGKVVPALYPEPEKDVKGAAKKHENRVEGLAQVWNGGTQEGIRGTAWGAYNVLTEANQWLRQMRKGNAENFLLAGAGFDGPTNTFRQKSLAVVKEVAGVK